MNRALRFRIEPSWRDMRQGIIPLDLIGVPVYPRKRSSEAVFARGNEPPADTAAVACVGEAALSRSVVTRTS